MSCRARTKVSIMAWKATTAGLCRSSFRAACALLVAGSAAGLPAVAAETPGLSMVQTLPCCRMTAPEPGAATRQHSQELREMPG